MLTITNWMIQKWIMEMPTIDAIVFCILSGLIVLMFLSAAFVYIYELRRRNAEKRRIIQNAIRDVWVDEWESCPDWADSGKFYNS